MSDLVNGPAGGGIHAACIHPHSIARIASASLHARLSSSTTLPPTLSSLYVPFHQSMSQPNLTYPQRRSACAIRPPSPRVMPAIHPICPAPGPAHARPASSSLAQHGQTVRLVALCRARRPPEVKRAETRPGALVDLFTAASAPRPCCPRSPTRGRCDPQPALLARFPHPGIGIVAQCVLREALPPTSLPCHARDASCCHARYTLTTLRALHRTSFFFCACPGAQKQCIVARVAYRHIGAQVCINPPQMSFTRLQNKHASSPRLPKHWPKPVQSRPKRASPHLTQQPETRLPAPHNPAARILILTNCFHVRALSCPLSSSCSVNLRQPSQTRPVEQTRRDVHGHAAVCCFLSISFFFLALS